MCAQRARLGQSRQGVTILLVVIRYFAPGASDSLNLLQLREKNRVSFLEDEEFFHDSPRVKS